MELGATPIKLILDEKEDAYLLFRGPNNRTQLQIQPLIEAREDRQALVALSIALFRENFLSSEKIAVYGQPLTRDNFDLLDNGVIVSVVSQYITEIFKRLGIQIDGEKKTEPEEQAKG